MAMNTNQTIDVTQAMQTLKWLDEERLKDKATIATLQERVQGQELQLSQQAAQIQELQTTLAGIQSVLSRATQFEQTVSKYKNELILEMEHREEARRKEQAESERLRQIEYEALTVTLNQVEKDLRLLPRHSEELNARRAENQRLSEAFRHVEDTVADLSKRSDDRMQAVAYLEERRRADNRRITDLEHDTTELHKRLESLTTKFPLFEETLQKQKTRIEGAIQEMKGLEKLLEELRVSDFQREQKMKQYVDQGEQVAQEMERMRAQTQGFIEHQQLVKRALEKLEGFQARLEKRQNEVTEMQRVAEDRVKRQWEEWQEEQAKQQKKRDVVTDEHRRQQGRINDEHRKLLETLQSMTEVHRNQLDTLWEVHRSDAAHALKSAQDDYEALTAQADAQLSILRGQQ